VRYRRGEVKEEDADREGNGKCHKQVINRSVNQSINEPVGWSGQSLDIAASLSQSTLELLAAAQHNAAQPDSIAWEHGNMGTWGVH
jgi:hypothetical protein